MNFRKALIFIGCAAPVCALLNCLVMFFTIEAESGFFRLGYDSFAVFMLCFIAALIVLCAVAFARISRPAEPDFWPLVSCLAGLALGVCLIIEVFNFKPLVGTSEPFAIAIRIFGFASGIVFIWQGLSNLSFIPMIKPVLIIPVVFFLMRVVSCFIAYAGVATITETVFELFAICAMLIFSLNFAKRENGIKSKKGSPLYLPVSIACAMIILSQIAPYAANYLLKENVLLHANSLFIPTSIALSLFIGVNVIFSDKSDSEKRVKKI